MQAKNAVLGHRGMVGSSIVRALGVPCYTAIGDLTDRIITRRIAADMIYAGVSTLYSCAAKVGGIQANIDLPVDFLCKNLAIELNVIEAAQSAGVDLFVFLGSSCIYPREAECPIREDALLTGPLEKTNEFYAVAKIAGIKMCEAYRRRYRLKSLILMPCNLYGPGDNYNVRSSHVIPALIRKLHEAKLSGASSVTLWGTGTARREFMHVDDLATAVLALVEAKAEGMVNIGSGIDQTIAETAQVVADVVGFHGAIEFDGNTNLDGTPRKLLDVSRLRSYGWDAARPLREGIEDAYRCFAERIGSGVAA